MISAIRQLPSHIVSKLSDVSIHVSLDLVWCKPHNTQSSVVSRWHQCLTARYNKLQGSYGSASKSGSGEGPEQTYL